MLPLQGADVAKARFEAVVKAHAVLTSPVAARNYAKYGNPDGYQGFKFGIALPAWAMTERAFLACFLVVVVVVPLLFCVDGRMQTHEAEDVLPHHWLQKIQPLHLLRLTMVESPYGRSRYARSEGEAG